MGSPRWSDKLPEESKPTPSRGRVRFLDHLIIGDTAPFSFKANGLL